MFNKRIIERLVIVFCLFLFPAVAAGNAEDLFSFEVVRKVAEDLLAQAEMFASPMSRTKAC
jgi:hypothetical protein